MTFVVWRVSDVRRGEDAHRHRAGLGGVESAEPSAKLSPTTGIVTVGPPSVPMNSSSRPGWPSLKMITAS